MFLIFFLEDRVQFQENFCRGILRVFRLTKEPTADLQDLSVVSGIDKAQNLRASLQGLIEGRAEPWFFEEDRGGSSCHNHSFF
jgi:hypothetical protein